MSLISIYGQLTLAAQANAVSHQHLNLCAWWLGLKMRRLGFVLVGGAEILKAFVCLAAQTSDAFPHSPTLACLCYPSFLSIKLQLQGRGSVLNRCGSFSAPYDWIRF